MRSWSFHAETWYSWVSSFRNVLVRRPDLLNILCLCSLIARSQRPLLIRELVSKVLSNLCASSKPDIVFGLDVLDNLLEGRETGGLADTATVEGNGDHFWRSLTALVVKNVKGAFYVIIKVGWGAETSWDVEFVVVAVVGVWDHEHSLWIGFVLFRWDVHPVWNITVVVLFD